MMYENNLLLFLAAFVRTGCYQGALRS